MIEKHIKLSIANPLELDFLSKILEDIKDKPDFLYRCENCEKYYTISNCVIVNDLTVCKECFEKNKNQKNYIYEKHDLDLVIFEDEKEEVIC